MQTGWPGEAGHRWCGAGQCALRPLLQKAFVLPQKTLPLGQTLLWEDLNLARTQQNLDFETQVLQTYSAWICDSLFPKRLCVVGFPSKLHFN